MKITDKKILKKINVIIGIDKPIKYMLVRFEENTMKAPIWFREFEKKNDERWDKQEKFNEEQLKFNKMIFDKLENVIKKNNLKT